MAIAASRQPFVETPSYIALVQSRIEASNFRALGAFAKGKIPIGHNVYIGNVSNNYPEVAGKFTIAQKVKEVLDGLKDPVVQISETYTEVVKGTQLESRIVYYTHVEYVAKTETKEVRLQFKFTRSSDDVSPDATPALLRLDIIEKIGSAVINT